MDKFNIITASREIDGTGIFVYFVLKATDKLKCLCATVLSSFIGKNL